MDVPLDGDQQRELDRSVIEYLRWRCGENESEIIDALAQSLKVTESEDPSRLLLLPRKWTSIVRLQRRIMALEHTCRELRELNSSRDASHGTADASRVTWLPPAQPCSSITVESPVASVRLHPELALVFVATEHGRLHCFDVLDTSIPMASIQAHTRAITSVDCVCVEGTTYVATGSKDMQARVFTWEASGGLRLLRSFQGHEHVVSGVRLWLNGKDLLVASCSRDTFVKVWDVLKGWCVKSFQPHADWVRCLDVQGEYLVTGAQDATLRLTHWPSGNGLSVGIGHSFPIESVAFVPAAGEASEWFGECVSTSRDRTAKIWSIPAPRLLPHRAPVPHSADAQFHNRATLEGHQSWVRCVRIRGPHIFTTSDDRSVKCWELATGNCKHTWEDAHQGFVSCIDLDGTAQPVPRRIAVTGGIDCKCHIFMQ